MFNFSRRNVFPLIYFSRYTYHWFRDIFWFVKDMVNSLIDFSIIIGITRRYILPFLGRALHLINVIRFRFLILFCISLWFIVFCCFKNWILSNRTFNVFCDLTDKMRFKITDFLFFSERIWWLGIFLWKVIWSCFATFFCLFRQKFQFLL